jgi:hypothetical protein
MPEIRPDSPERGADCGRSTSGLFAIWGRTSSWWRTYLPLFTGESTVFSGIWPRWGTMLSGRAYRHAPSVPPTRGRERGLWPTLLHGDEWGREGTARNKWGRILGVFKPTTAEDFADATPLLSAETLLGISSEVFGEPSMPPKWRSRMDPCWAEQFMGYPKDWTAIDD